MKQLIPHLLIAASFVITWMFIRWMYLLDDKYSNEPTAFDYRNLHKKIN